MRIISFFFLLVLLPACESSKKLSNQNLAYLYAPGLNYMHPVYRICNTGTDTSRIFFQAFADELLFMKADEAGGFKSSFALSYLVLPDYESKIPVDSGTVYFEQDQDSLPGATISNFIDVRTPDSANYIIQVVFTDINRQQAVASFHTIDRTGIQPPQDFMVLNAANNQPFYGDFTNTEAALRLVNPRNEMNQVYLRYFRIRFPLSKPPFSEDEEPALSYRSDETPDH